MDLMQLLSAIPASLLPSAIIFYFYNENNIKWMQERKELAEEIMAERKEVADMILDERRDWRQERKEMIERQFAAMENTTKELAATRSENHAMRGKVHELILRLDTHLFNRPGKPNG